MLRVDNINVYNIEHALRASGYPMRTRVEKEKLEKMLARGSRLGNTPIGAGHDKFLRGILVSFDLTASRYFWHEWDTYHFAESISSQSTMHCITKTDVARSVDSHVDKRILRVIEEIIEEYNTNPNEENFLKIKANLPEGFIQTRGITTNYAQLKTIFHQRNAHRLPEWREFCHVISTLDHVITLGVC